MGWLARTCGRFGEDCCAMGWRSALRIPMDPGMLPALSLQSCLALAVEIERAGALSYARMAKRHETNAPLRDLLMSLAEDERSHEELFNRFLIASPVVSTVTEMSSTQSTGRLADRFFTSPLVVLQKLHESSSLHQALTIALQFERQTLELFEQLRLLLVEKSLIENLDRVIETEQLHCSRLQALVGRPSADLQRSSAQEGSESSGQPNTTKSHPG